VIHLEIGHVLFIDIVGYSKLLIEARGAQRTGIFSQDQPENSGLLDDLALINMDLGDKAAALALIEREIAANPIEKDAVAGPRSDRDPHPSCGRHWRNPTAPLLRYRNYFRYQARSLLRYPGSIRCSIRSEMIHALKTLRREATKRSRLGPDQDSASAFADQCRRRFCVWESSR
jgi:hypothetical protein